MFQAKPQSSEALLKTTTPNVNSRRRPNLSASDRDRFVDHVVVTSKYEWMFWDAAWRREAWPL